MLASRDLKVFTEDLPKGEDVRHVAKEVVALKQNLTAHPFHIIAVLCKHTIVLIGKSPAVFL